MSKIRLAYTCFITGVLIFALGQFFRDVSDMGDRTRTGQFRDRNPLQTAVALADAPDSGEAGTNKDSEVDAEANYETLTLRGKVRYLGPALKERYGIETVPESAERQMVLDVPGGELVPIVEDIRGRAFRADERLRGIEVELLGRRYRQSPFVQVIRLSAVKKEGLFVLDYWCDVCAIAMYELKPCDCCQAPNRLRERRVTAEGIADEEQ